MTKDISNFYIDNNGKFPYDPELPYVVVGVSNELAGRFPDAIGAEIFLVKGLKLWGRIIDTSLVR